MGIPAPGGAQALHWVLARSANHGNSGIYNGLNGVSCTSPTACMAVGDWFNPSIQSELQPMAQSWDGAHWSLLSVPNPKNGLGGVLNGASCTAANACMAVGAYDTTGTTFSQTLAERWNGTRWSVLPSPNTGPSNNVLNAVSCTSAAACTAVGFWSENQTQTSPRQTLIESWNGTSWKIVASLDLPSSDLLFGVSCTGPAACVAVGEHILNGRERTLAEAWNGTTWSLLPTINPGSFNDYLDGISCLTATSCTAVGATRLTAHQLDRTLVESWNGTAWSVVPSPNKGSGPAANNDLFGVSCASKTACTAVGQEEIVTLVESWDGTRWSVLPSPNRPPGADDLAGVSCPTTTACTAAGAYFNSGPTLRTLIEAGKALPHATGRPGPAAPGVPG